MEYLVIWLIGAQRSRGEQSRGTAHKWQWLRGGHGLSHDDQRGCGHSAPEQQHRWPRHALGPDAHLADQPEQHPPEPADAPGSPPHQQVGSISINCVGYDMLITKGKRLAGTSKLLTILGKLHLNRANDKLIHFVIRQLLDDNENL